MQHFFLNPWMLLGLAGVLLPVLAHLLSRKKYDIVEWGAMQFLELDPSARRKLRLEELLLLAVRMGLVALLAIALARPWLGGAWLGSFGSTQPRDVVLVIDGSYSMGWEGRALTPHANAVRVARQFVEELRPGDSVMVVDAREQPLATLAGLTRDKQRVREALESLPSPAGTANLHAAISKAVQSLASGTNLQREVVVFTDRQALSWKPDDEALWARLDDLKEQSPQPPRLWVMDVAEGQLGHSANFTIDRLQLSRELAVPGVPVRISSKVRYSGGENAISRKVHLEVNGQRLADQTLQLKLLPNGEATVEFERRFEQVGSQLIGVVLENDALPGDNRSEAVVLVADSLPIVLADGDKRLDPTRSETFFARAALMATGSEASWIKPTILTPDAISAETLRDAAVLVLANVETLSAEQLSLLGRFVASGRGLLFALGDKTPQSGFTQESDQLGTRLLPVSLKAIGAEAVAAEAGKSALGVRIAGNSLELPWLKPFRSDKGGTLTDARFTQWWRVSVQKEATDNASQEPTKNKQMGENSGVSLGTPIVIAKLTNGDPWLVTRRYGRGTTAVLTSSLDADWNTLPAKQDYVPWLHELLFALASPTTSRNVDVGTPLSLNISPLVKLDDFEFLTPSNAPLPATRIDDDFQPGARLDSATLPGVYRFAAKANASKPSPTDELFVTNFDRGESDLTPLTDDQCATLAGANRLTFVTDLVQMQRQMFADGSRTELWWLLLYGFLAFLAFEVWLTRRMLNGATREAE